MKPKHFPPIRTMANGSFLEGNKRNMEEIGGVSKGGKIYRKEPGWVPFCGLFRGEKKYFRGIGDTWYPLTKNKELL